jgi:Xaa-Pro aminopeptidase
MQALKADAIVVPCEKLRGGEPGIDYNTAVYDFLYLTGRHQEGDLLVITPEETICFAGSDGAAEGFLRRFERIARWEHPWKKGGDRTVTQAITTLRAVKSEVELSLLRKASEITCRGLVAAMKECRPGMNEGDLQKVIEKTWPEGTAFPSIVGSGENGTEIHYMKNEDPIPENTLIVCDVGASYRGYAGDVTRTLPSSRRFSKEHREAYEAVLDAMKAAEKMLKPGARYRDLHERAGKVLEEKGFGGWSFVKFHYLGHHVGLSVHDPTPRMPLEAGMVVTIEPGIYDEERGFGIRIEDTYIVTAEGFERISAAAPREVEEIERLMKPFDR